MKKVAVETSRVLTDFLCVIEFNLDRFFIPENQLRR